MQVFEPDLVRFQCTARGFVAAFRTLQAVIRHSVWTVTEHIHANLNE